MSWLISLLLQVDVAYVVGPLLTARKICLECHKEVSRSEIAFNGQIACYKTLREQTFVNYFNILIIHLGNKS